MMPAHRAAVTYRSRPLLSQPGRGSASWRLEALRGETPHAPITGRVCNRKLGRLRRAFARDIREKLAAIDQQRIDVHVIDYSARPLLTRHDLEMLAGSRPLSRSGGKLAAAIHLEDRIYQIALLPDLKLTVMPWVCQDVQTGFFEGDFTTMDVTWFLFLRPGIDAIAIDVARLLPNGTPSDPRDPWMAAWLREFFAAEVNPGLPLPYDLTPAPAAAEAVIPQETADLVRCAMTIFGDAPRTIAISLPEGPFGIARFARSHHAVMPKETADRLSILVNMIAEDIPINASWPQGVYHPDLRPRIAGPFAPGVTVSAAVTGAAHDRLEAVAHLTAVYRAKRDAWLKRWPLTGPDGFPVSEDAVRSLDELFGVR